MFIFLLFLFILFVGGGWRIGKSLGNLFFPDREEKSFTYIDKSVHHHHHHHEHKNISIIDDVTKKKIFELKDKN